MIVSLVRRVGIQRAGLGRGLIRRMAESTTSSIDAGSLVPSESVTAARIMLPDDTNPSGNVHGGTILKLMADNGGAICAKKFVNRCKRGSSERLDVALVSISDMNFWGPMFVGDLAQVSAKVNFTSRSSIQVAVQVFADDMAGTRRLTNEATLWYVTASHATKEIKPALVRDLPSYSASPEATQKYEEQKKLRQIRREAIERRGDRDAWKWTALLSQLILPSDCYQSSFVQGGVILKLMDNAAGIAAWRHCKTNVVTASLESLDFTKPIFNGNLVTIRARPTFASSKSLEVHVVVEAEDLSSESGPYVAVEGYLVFVSLDANGKPLPIQPLSQPETEWQVRDRDEARQRYETRKRKLAEKRKN